MLDRSLFAAVLIVLGVATWIAYNRLSIFRLAKRGTPDPLLADLRSGVPTIVYFTTPYCVPCRTLQRPALDALKAEFGPGIQVIQVDSDQQPEIADRWGVFSAPTTFLLDGQHKPRTVNRGVASAETLKKQLQAIA
jgi:thiol-disulfide isomerase/thioredoxin